MNTPTEVPQAFEGYDIQILKNAYHILDRRREANRKCSKKYYDKTMKLGEDASLIQLTKQKDMLNKRDVYQKSYYAKNREAICERQRLYRLSKKTNK